MSSSKRLIVLAAVVAVVATVAPAMSSNRRAGHVIQPFPAVKKFSKAERQALNKQWAGKPYSFREASGDGITKRQPNGHEFAAFVSPAEVGGRLEDSSGHTIIQNSLGWWTYALKSKRGGIVASKLIVGRNSPKSIAPHLGRTQAIFIDPTSGKDLRTQLYEYFRAQSVSATQAAQAAGEVRNYKIPAILFETYGEFAPGSNAEATQKFLNGYSDTNSTVTEFYQEMSYGQMKAQVDVYGPYKSVISQVDHCHYGGITTAGQNNYASPQNDLIFSRALGVGGGGVAGMALEAIPMADVDVDFSQYDNNDDGFVDLVFIIHSGPDMAITGDPCMTWSHAISLQPAIESASPVPAGIPTNDGVFVANMNTVPELGVPNGMDVGVVSHEMSHNLGEPDFYDTSYKSEGTGGWDNMAEGSHYGDPPGSNPIHFNPMVKLAQAWIEPKVITKTTRGLRLRPWESYQDIVMVPLRRGDDPSTTETETDSIIEANLIHFSSRSAHGPRKWGSPIDGADVPALFDRNLLNSGLMIWHMDRSTPNNHDSARYRLDLEEFDYFDFAQELSLGQGGGEPSDPWFDTATGPSGAVRSGAKGGALPAPLTFSGTAVPTAALAEAPPAYTYEFAVPNNPGIYSFTIKETCASEGGDWDLYVDEFRGGSWVEVTSGATGACSESAGVFKPKLGGRYRARIANFLAPDVAGGFTGAVTWGKGEILFSADTFNNEGQATGWTIGNIRPTADAFSLASEVMASEYISFDVLKDPRADLSPGFLKSAEAILDGATSRLGVEVFNNGPAAAKDVTVTLSEGATVLEEKTVGSLAGTSFKIVDFAWKPPTVGLHHLKVSVATASDEASTDNNSQITSVAAYPANAADGVLIVDDDDNFEMQQAYEASLLALGVPYAVTGRHPSLAELKRYKTVFWQNGVAQQEGNLSTEDRAALKSYLDEGGKVWFSGGWIAGALAAQDDTTYGSVSPGTDPTFAANYLGIGFVGRQTRAGGLAVPSSGFTKQIAYKPYPGRVNASVAKLVSSGAGVATKIYDIKAGTDAVGVGGTTVLGDAAHKNFRTVFTAFNLGTVVKPEDQIALVSAVLKQLSGSTITKTVTITVGTASAASTIDAPVVLHVPLQWSRRGEAQVITATVGGVAVTGVELMYRRFLTNAYHTVAMTERAPGIYEAVLPGSAFQVPGVEYSITVNSASGAIKLPRGQAGGYFVSVADGPASPDLPYSLSSVLGSRFKPSGVSGSRSGGVAPRPVTPGLPATGVGSGWSGLLLIVVAAVGAVALRRRTEA